jgi:hypothetical protein
MPLLTLFTCPKPFTNPHIATIQRNAIRSWCALGDEVEVIVIGEEEGLAEAAAELGVRHIREVGRNAQGTPLVSSLFALARQASSAPLQAYVNTDILLFGDFLTMAKRVAEQRQRFLIVGQRWDLDLREPLDFGPGWQAKLQARIAAEGKLHPPAGSDYFIYPRECFAEMPPLAVGRAGWDNWMIYYARVHGWEVVDATAAVRIVHQSHDYSHLPGGQPHYRLPETGENVRLAGGRRTIFHLEDASCRLDADGRILPLPRTWKRFTRELETFPLTHLHSRPLGELSFALFHPYKAYAEWRKKKALPAKDAKGNEIRE